MLYDICLGKSRLFNFCIAYEKQTAPNFIKVKHPLVRVTLPCYSWARNLCVGSCPSSSSATTVQCSFSNMQASSRNPSGSGGQACFWGSLLHRHQQAIQQSRSAMVLPPALSRAVGDSEASETDFHSCFHKHHLLFSVIFLQYNAVFFPTYIFLLILQLFTFPALHSPCLLPTPSVSHLSPQKILCVLGVPLSHLYQQHSSSWKRKEKKEKKRKNKESLILIQNQWIRFWFTWRNMKGERCRDAIIRQHVIVAGFAAPCFLHRTKLCFQPMLYRCTHTYVLSKRTHSKAPKMKNRDCNVLDVILSLGREDIHQRRGNGTTVKPQEIPKAVLQSYISGVKFQLGKHLGSVLLRRTCIASQTSLIFLFHIDKSTTYKRLK